MKKKFSILVVLSSMLCSSSGVVGSLSSFKSPQRKNIMEWSDAARDESNNKTIILSNLTSLNYLTPKKIFDGQMEHSKYGFIDLNVYLTKINSYDYEGQKYSNVKLDFSCEFIPGSASAPSDMVHLKKYYNYEIEDDFYTNSFTENTSKIDYWPRASDEPQYPPITVLKNHPTSLNLGTCYDATTSTNLKYDVFGYFADRAVKIGLNGNYSDAYSVVHNLNLRDNLKSDFSSNSEITIGEGHMFKIMNFSSKKEDNESYHKSYRINNGVLYNIKADSNGKINGDVMWHALHSVRSKNIFNVWQFYTRLNYNLNIKFEYYI